MFLPQRISGFAWRLLLYYVLLGVAPWPGVRDAYADLFRATGNAVFGSFGRTGHTLFQPAPASLRMWDTRVLFRFEASPRRSRLTYNAWISGWIPVATLVALVLATRISWSRRWKALNGFCQLFVWGVIVTAVIIAARFTGILWWTDWKME